MKLSKKEKLEIYLESFDVLKDSFDEYEAEITDLIVYVSKISVKDSISIWKTLLKTYMAKSNETEGTIYSEDSSLLIGEILDYIMINSHTYEFATEFIKDQYMVDKVFAESDSIVEGHASVITDLINCGNFDKACELINILKKNPNAKRTDDFNIDDIIILNMENLKHEQLENLDSTKMLGLIDEIEDIKKKAVAKVQLISKMG